MKLNILFFVVLISLETLVKRCSAQITCEYSDTQCSCRLRKPGEGGCIPEQNAPANLSHCDPAICEKSWMCDCLEPTDICARSTCQRWMFDTSQPTAVCTQQGMVSCVTAPSTMNSASPTASPSFVSVPLQSQSIGGGLAASPTASTSMSMSAGAAASSASPSPTPSPTSSVSSSVTPTATTSTTPSPTPSPDYSCVTSDDCIATQRCVFGTCRDQGVCDTQLEAYCSALQSDLQCCDSTSDCAVDNLQTPSRMCATRCDTSCTTATGDRIECVFQGGEILLLGGGAISHCPAVI